MFAIATLPPTVTIEAPAFAGSEARSAFVDSEGVYASASEYASAYATANLAAVIGWGVTSMSQAFGDNSQPSWSLALSESASRLRDLPVGWDGVGSRAPRSEIVFRVERLVRRALEGLVLASDPYLVPGGDGSVQIEWHEKAGEIELSINDDESVYIWGRNHISGYEFEAQGEAALALFSHWALRLASSRFHANDVALATPTASLVAA